MTITNRVSLKSANGGNTPIADVVDAPTISTATAGEESATVTFTAAATGGAATSFGAISTPGSITGTSATSPITVSGLTGGTAYTFKTYGINSAGTWSAVLSASSNSVTPSIPSSYESIATVTVGSGGSANIEFTSIPATYTHLQIRGIFKTDRADDNDRAKIQFNSDTGSNYSNNSFLGTGSSVTAAVNANASSMLTFVGAGNNASNIFGAGVIDILEYKNTNIYKTIKSLGGYQNNSNGIEGLDGGNWRSTSAITSIKLTPNIGSNFKQYSQFALYGIKGA